MHDHAVVGRCVRVLAVSGRRVRVRRGCTSPAVHAFGPTACLLVPLAALPATPIPSLQHTGVGPHRGGSVLVPVYARGAANSVPSMSEWCSA